MTSGVFRLLIANVIVMVMTTISPALESALAYVPFYALTQPWTIITYMFVHGNFAHIFFNMLALYFFGPRLELELGGRKFMGLYFASGIVAAVVSSVFSYMTPIIGASGAVYGVMLGFAYYWPKEPIYIYGLLPVQSRILIIFMTILSLFGGLHGVSDGIAHFAHLGGFLGGFLFLRLFGRRKFNGTQVEQSAVPVPGKRDIQRWSGIPRESLHPVNRDEFDRIMAKLTEEGVESLDEREIEFLNRFSTS